MPTKPKSRTVFVCQQCGSEQPKWTGRCPDCGEWNTFTEQTVTVTSSASAMSPSIAARGDGTGNKPTSLPQVQSGNFRRLGVPGEEFNRVLGGGIVPGSLVLIGGDPGIGKCVVGETRVLDPGTGAYRAIADYASGDRQVLSVNEQTLCLSPDA